jgi:hypothetical protein
VEIPCNHLPPIERLVNLDIAGQQYATVMALVQKKINRNPKLPQPWALPDNRDPTKKFWPTIRYMDRQRDNSPLIRPRLAAIVRAVRP